MKSFIMQIYSALPHPPFLLPLRPKFLPQPAILEYPQPMLYKGQQISHQYKATGKFVVLYSLFFKL